MPPLHASIAEPDSTKFLPQTAQGLQDILRHFDSCTTKKSLQEAEVALGWNAEMLRRSALMDPHLTGWVTLQSFVFDACINIGPVDKLHKNLVFGTRDWLRARFPWTLSAHGSRLGGKTLGVRRPCIFFRTKCSNVMRTIAETLKPVWWYSLFAGHIAWKCSRIAQT